MRYVIQLKHKKQWFYRSIKKVKGHQLVGDRLDIFLDDGIISLCNWSEYDMKLGSDFILFQKAEMEKETGLNIKIDGAK